MRNPYGLTSKSPKEWGRKNRKEEDKLRGFRSRGRRDSIAEQEEDQDEEEGE